MVDASILSDLIHPESNIQGGRITKNLEKIEIYVTNVSLFLDGACISPENHEVELSLSYDFELTLRLGKALLIDTKGDQKRMLRNLEETVFYTLPVLDRCVLSEEHK